MKFWNCKDIIACKFQKLLQLKEFLHLTETVAHLISLNIVLIPCLQRKYVTALLIYLPWSATNHLQELSANRETLSFGKIPKTLNPSANSKIACRNCTSVYRTCHKPMIIVSHLKFISSIFGNLRIVISKKQHMMENKMWLDILTTILS